VTSKAFDDTLTKKHTIVVVPGTGTRLDDSVVVAANAGATRNVKISEISPAMSLILTIVPIPFRVLMDVSSHVSPASAAHGRRRGEVFPP